jgi:hypothetical protein
LFGFDLVVAIIGSLYFAPSRRSFSNTQCMLPMCVTEKKITAVSWVKQYLTDSFYTEKQLHIHDDPTQAQPTWIDVQYVVHHLCGVWNKGCVTWPGNEASQRFCRNHAYEI